MEEAIALDSIQAIAASFGASFDAEKITDSVLEKDGTRYYKVRWVKYSWEPAASFTHLEHLIRAFWNQYAQNPDSVDCRKSQDSEKILEETNVADALAHHTVVENEGKTVPSILSSLNPIFSNLGQVAAQTELQIQQPNLQLVAAASFSQLPSIEQNNQHQQLQILSNIQPIPINVQHDLQEHSTLNPEARKTSRPKKSQRDPNETKKKNQRRKIPGTCNICGKFFKSTTNIAAHRKLHTEERQFECPQCGKKFRRKLHLTRHLESHAGIKSFVCNICGSAFSSKWYMQAHAVVHTGEKPYSCDICDKRFNNKANLSKHKLIHVDKRPFVCNTCGQTYRQSYDLKRHMTTHSEEKIFRCNQCEKTFARKTYLHRHLLTHTSEKNFQCTLCSRKFIQQGQLNFHLKQHENRNKRKWKMEENNENEIILEVEPVELEETGNPKENTILVDFAATPTSSCSTEISADEKVEMSSAVSDGIFMVQSANINNDPENMAGIGTNDQEKAVAMGMASANPNNIKTFEIIDASSKINIIDNTQKDVQTEKRYFPVDHIDYFQTKVPQRDPQKLAEKPAISQELVNTKDAPGRLFPPGLSSDGDMLKLHCGNNPEPLAEEHAIKNDDDADNFSGEQENLLVFPNSAQNNSNMFL